MSDPQDQRNPPQLPGDDPSASGPLSYQSRPYVVPYKASQPFSQFVVGVGLGIGIVALVGFSNVRFGRPLESLMLFAAGEFVAGIILTIVSARFRPLGIGLIAAMPIGLLIAFVGCAIILKLN